MSLSLRLFLVLLCAWITEQAVCPDGCVCTNDQNLIVDCSGAGLNSIPDLSSIDSVIGRLDLSSNSISDISAGFSSDFFANGTELLLDDNFIQEIPHGVFGSLPPLGRLSLKRNQITKLPANSLRELHGANQDSIIDLTGNPIETIEGSAFAYLNQMSILIGDSNVSLTVEAYVFYGICDVPEIHIMKVPALTLNPGAFTNAERVSKLRISGVTMETLAGFTFQGLTQLRSIHFHDCELNEVQSYAFGGIQYYGGSATGNSIDPWPLEPQDGTVEFRSCQIQKLPSDSFRDTNLAHLLLQDCTIKYIMPHFIRGLISLTNVHLVGNVIHHLSQASLGSVSGVQEIHLDYNDLRAISSYAFQQTQEIVSFRIKIKSGGHLTLEPNAFGSMRDIHHFLIEGEDPSATLTISPNAFNGLVGVNDLDITNVLVPVLQTQSFRGIGKVRLLRFASCNMSQIESKAFDNGLYGPGSIDVLDLSQGNNLQCDCKILEEFEDIFVNVTLKCTESETGLEREMTYNNRQRTIRWPSCREVPSSSSHWVASWRTSGFFVILLVYAFR